MRILLIEDDEILTSVLVNALQQQRYVVETVDDGQFGLEYEYIFVIRNITVES